MILLIITICTTAAMNDCQVHRVAEVETPKQCEAVAGVYRKVLGPAESYRIECIPRKERP